MLFTCHHRYCSRVITDVVHLTSRPCCRKMEHKCGSTQTRGPWGQELPWFSVQSGRGTQKQKWRKETWRWADRECEGQRGCRDSVVTNSWPVSPGTVLVQYTVRTRDTEQNWSKKVWRICCCFVMFCSFGFFVCVPPLHSLHILTLHLCVCLVYVYMTTCLKLLLF